MASAVATRRYPLVASASAGFAVPWLVASARAQRATHQRGAVPTTGEKLRVVAVNLQASNACVPKAAKALAALAPDVVLACEVDDAALTTFAKYFGPPAAAASITVDGTSRVHTAVFVTSALTQHPVTPLVAGQRQFARRLVRVGQKWVLVTAVHTTAPRFSRWVPAWHAQLAVLATPASHQVTAPDGRVPAMVLGGDFNASLLHRPMARVLAAGFVDALRARGRGLAPTWSPHGRGRARLFSLDHVLVNGAVPLAAFTVAVPGSDHRAVVTDLAVGDLPSTSGPRTVPPANRPLPKV